MMPLDYSFLHIGLFIIVFAISFINKKPNINIYYSYPCRLLIIYNLLSLGGILFISYFTLWFIFLSYDISLGRWHT